MSQRTLRVPAAALAAFIADLAAGASISAACRKAGVAQATVYALRQRDEEFALRWADAIEEGTDALEDVLTRRALDGLSDTAAIFLLKARRPDRYRERVAVQHSAATAPDAASLERNRALGLDPAMEASRLSLPRRLHDPGGRGPVTADHSPNRGELVSRRTLNTPPRAQETFIEELSNGATIKEACRIAGMARSTAYQLRQRDEDFALHWADALEEGTEALEEEARRRAMEGSDHLMIFLLKARRPEVYRERLSVDQTTRLAPVRAEERRAIQAAAARDPDAFERVSHALAAEMREGEETIG